MDDTFPSFMVEAVCHLLGEKQRDDAASNIFISEPALTQGNESTTLAVHRLLVKLQKSRFHNNAHHIVPPLERWRPLYLDHLYCFILRNLFSDFFYARVAFDKYWRRCHPPPFAAFCSVCQFVCWLSSACLCQTKRKTVEEKKKIYSTELGEIEQASVVQAAATMACTSLWHRAASE